MGEEEKKPEEGKKADNGDKPSPKKNKGKKQEEKGKNDEGQNAKEKPPPPPPPPPEEVVMKVFMHCEGCANKVRRSLIGLPGVDEVVVDCKTQKVVAKGRKAAEDPMRVVERVQKKAGRKVELISPIPQPKQEKKTDEDKPKPAEQKKEARRDH